MFFCKMKIVTSHRAPRGGAGGLSQCHQMTHGGRGPGGSKIGQKSFTYYLNGPLLRTLRGPSVLVRYKRHIVITVKVYVIKEQNGTKNINKFLNSLKPLSLKMSLSVLIRLILTLGDVIRSNFIRLTSIFEGHF